MNDLLLGQPPLPTTEDAFRRRVSYLRISLTDRCNLKCRYCMPQGGMIFFPSENLLSTEELRRLMAIFVSLGVTKVRLTGGEPLLRADLEELLQEAAALGIPDVSVTTNGIFLAGRAKTLAAAGLKRINISLDTFQRDRFLKITGSDGLDRVLQGITAALEEGLQPVKINMVVMREWNFDEITDFVRFAERLPVEVRFLELMPTKNNLNGSAGVDASSFVSSDEIRREVEKIARLEAEEPVRGVARVFPLTGGLGKVGFVSPVSNHFCAACNRIRLTASGGLKTCLHGEDIVDLRTALREGASDAVIIGMIRGAIFRKPEEHFIRPDRYVSPFLQMSQVGG